MLRSSCVVIVASPQDKRNGVMVCHSPITFFLLCQPMLMPEKPINAMASSPAQSRAMGVPCIAFGTSAISSCSRTPANITSASAKPNAVDIP